MSQPSQDAQVYSHCRSRPLGPNERVIELPMSVFLEVVEKIGMVNRWSASEVTKRPNFVLFSLEGNRIVFTPKQEDMEGIK